MSATAVETIGLEDCGDDVDLVLASHTGDEENVAPKHVLLYARNAQAERPPTAGGMSEMEEICLPGDLAKPGASFKGGSSSGGLQERGGGTASTSSLRGLGKAKTPTPAPLQHIDVRDTMSPGTQKARSGIPSLEGHHGQSPPGSPVIPDLTDYAAAASPTASDKARAERGCAVM